MKSRLFACCAAALAAAGLVFSAAADIVLDFEGEKTLSQALTDAGFSLAAVNGGDKKSSIIQKSGTGTLVLDTAIPNYVASKWVINNGVVYCKVINAFGASSVQVAVRSGATVKMATNVKGLNTDRVIYLNGTGYNNMGALTLDGYGTASGYGYNCSGIFGKVSLQSNATVKSCNHHYVGDTISLNGFTYTIEAYSGSGETVYSTGVWGAGRIVLKNTVMRTYGTLALVDATATNAFDYNSGTAGIWFWNHDGRITDAGKNVWKHIFTSANAVIKCDSSMTDKNPFVRETEIHRIFGPVEIPAGGGATMSGQGNNGDYAVKISGAMSGSGSFATSSGIPSICHILNPANTFTGTFKVDTGILYFYEPGTLPSGAALQFNGANDYVRSSGATDSTDIPAFAGVVLSGVGEQTLGNVTVTGEKTRRLFGGETGRFGAVSKDGTGSFEYFTALDAGDVTLKNGTFKLPRGAKPGLYECYQDYADAATAKAALASFDPSAAASKYVMRGVLSSTCTKTDNYTLPGDKRIIAYKGYIWNRTGVERKVTILTSINGDDKIKVGANAWEDCCKSNYGNPWWKTYTLQPGATEIQYIAYNGGPKAKNGWKANCGIVYTDDGVDYGRSAGGTVSWDSVKAGLIANGKPLIDPGDGSVLTLSADAVPPAFDRVIGQGGALDLNGNAYTLTNFTGNLSVKSTVTDAAADAKINLGGLTLKTSDLNSAISLTATVPVTLGTDGVITLVEEGTLSTPSSFTVSSTSPIDIGDRDIADCVVVPEGWTAYLAPGGKTLSIERQIVLNVTADTTSLSAALEASGHTLADITTGAHKTTSLVMKGSGTLTLDVAVDGYAGKWVIENGVVYQKVANAFGPASVPVYIYDGGAVKVYGNSSTINSDRSFYIAGTGCNASGALFLDGDGDNNTIGYNAGTCYGDIYLIDDATIAHRNYHSIGRRIYLNGHTYTAKHEGTGNRAAYTYGIYGAGKVICDGVYLRTGVNNGTIELADTTPGNEIVYKNNGGGPWFFTTGQFTGLGAAVWKQTYQNGAISTPQASANSAVFGRENAQMLIKGPIEVQQDLKLVEGQGTIGSLYARWKGVVSGSGTITAQANAPTVIDLFNAANTFSGTISNEKGLVNVYGGTSLPAAATVEIGGDANHGTASVFQPLEFAGIEFYGPDVKTLGALTLKGSQTRRVQGGAGAWTSIVKNGSGTAEYYSALGAGKLTLNAGTFKLAKAGNVGLYEGVVDYPDNAKANSEGFLGSAYPHDFVVRGPIATAQLKGQNYPTLAWNRLITYDGYFWNRTGETQTYAFIGNFNGHAKLMIDGQVVFNIPSSGRATGEVSLTPGAHSFQFRGNYPAPTSNNLGLGWKLGEATDTLADYTQILDPGDGSIFTLAATDAQPVFEEIVGTSTGAFFDLNGTSFKAAKLGGSFTIGSSAEGGKLDLTGGLAVDASALVRGDSVAVNVPVDFGSTGAISVTGLASAPRGAHTLIRASSAIDFGGRDIASAFTVDDPKWTVTLKDGGKSIVLKRLGLAIMVR